MKQMRPKYMLNILNRDSETYNNPQLLATKGYEITSAETQPYGTSPAPWSLCGYT